MAQKVSILRSNSEIALTTKSSTQGFNPQNPTYISTLSILHLPINQPSTKPSIPQSHQTKPPHPIHPTNGPERPPQNPLHQTIIIQTVRLPPSSTSPSKKHKSHIIPFLQRPSNFIGKQVSPPRPQKRRPRHRAPEEEDCGAEGVGEGE